MLYNLIAKSFLTQDLNDPFSNMPGNFSHTERIAVVDARGNLRGYFDGLNQNAASAVVEEIAKLRNEKL
jgi:cytochrome oxidase Cu insertion factor (SCO1/SenC/PrrC family)